MRRDLSSLVAAPLVALALTLALAGCSDGAGDGPDVPPAASPVSASPAEASDVADGLAALYAGNTALPQDRSEARCFAAALQERLDPESLAAAGITGADGTVVDVLPVFDVPTAQAWVDAQPSCVGFVESSTRALLTQTRGELDATAYAECLRDALSDAEVRAALVQTLSGGFDSPEVATLAAAQATCADPR